ncbi:MAG: hypothetical protein ACO1NY_11020 [Pseudorhodoplanes sp.]
MSYSYVVPGERSSSGAARRWLFAYPLAQVLCLGAAGGAAALSSRLPSGETSYVTLATGVAVAAVYGLTFGYLRGCLLRERFARFSMIGWCAAIAAISLFFLPPEPETLPALSGAASNFQAAALAAMPVALSGFVYGLAIGAAEAVALRRAAFGLFGWAVVSGFAWGFGHIAASAVAGLAAPLQLTSFQAGAVQSACMTLQAAIAGLVMLTALRLLTPRLRYYGPRVYREALRTRD